MLFFVSFFFCKDSKKTQIKRTKKLNLLIISTKKYLARYLTLKEKEEKIYTIRFTSFFCRINRINLVRFLVLVVRGEEVVVDDSLFLF
jgi:hypothetical protein